MITNSPTKRRFFLQPGSSHFLSTSLLPTLVNTFFWGGRPIHIQSGKQLSWVVLYTRALKLFFKINHFRPTPQWVFSEELILKKVKNSRGWQQGGKKSLKQRWPGCPFDAFRFERSNRRDFDFAHNKAAVKALTSFLYPNYYSLRFSTCAVSIHSGCNWQEKKIRVEEEKGAWQTISKYCL